MDKYNQVININKCFWKGKYDTHYSHISLELLKQDHARLYRIRYLYTSRSMREWVTGLRFVTQEKIHIGLISISFFLQGRKVFFVRGLLIIFVNSLEAEKKITNTCPCLTFCWRKHKSISTCFILECWIEFLVRATTLVLSLHMIGIAYSWTLN